MSDIIIIVVLIVALTTGCCWEMFLKRKYPICNSCGRPYKYCKCEEEC